MKKYYSDIWQTMLKEARVASKDGAIKAFIEKNILSKKSFENFLASYLPNKLSCERVDYTSIRGIFANYCCKKSELIELAFEDLDAIFQRDPACFEYCYAALYSKGFHALQAYRISHALWKDRRYYLAALLNNRISERMGVDIHPAAKIGRGILIDHATGFVAGETVVIGDNVSILHGVTLGGSGKARGDRHPKIGNGVLIGAGATILGNVKIGDGAKIGAGSVVLQNAPAYSTMVGIPARII